MTVLLEVAGVYKKYSNDLHKSLRYGTQAILRELLRRPDAPHELKPSEFWALQNVDISVSAGQSFGLVGPNGAGKTTLLRILAGITRPEAGSVNIRAPFASLLDPFAGLNEVMSGRENIEVALAFHGRSTQSREKIVDEIVDFSGIGDVIDAPVRSYSTGMRMRLGFGVLLHINAKLLLIDEALVVGDSAFQNRCISELRSFCDDGGALIFVTHSLALFQAVATHAMYLSQGVVIDTGDPNDIARQYLKDLLAHSGGAAKAADPLVREAGALLTDLEAEVAADSTMLPNGSNPDPDGNANAPIDPSSHRPIRITSMSIEACDLETVTTGSDAVLSTSVESLNFEGPVLWGVSLWSGDLLISPAMTISGRSDPLVVTKGLTQWRCKIREMPLTPGHYALRTIIADAATMEPLCLFGYESEPLPFEVTAPSDVSWTWTGGTPLMVTDTRWERV